MNPRHALAQAVAVRENLIVKVGTNQDVTPLISKRTKVIDLAGRTVVPGLIDTHIHVADFGRCLLWLDLSDVDSIEKLKNALTRKVKQTPAGKWIIGRGWNEKHFKEKRLLNMSDLDDSAPHNPVVLYHETAMVCAVNTSALTLAGVTSQTVAPLGGIIDENPQTGELTGILRDAATSLIWRAVPEPTADELSEATTLACRKIVEAGITSVHWMLLSESELPLIRRLNAEGKLPVRVNVIVPYEFLSQAVRFEPGSNSMLRLGAVMIVTDGYLDSKTAALNQPYSDEPGNTGKKLLAQRDLAAYVSQVSAFGLQPVIHAMGDWAVDEALTVIEQVPAEKDVRFRIEQAAVLNADLIRRLKTRKIVVSVQPTVIATEFAVWSAEARLGVERARWLHPLKALLEAGVKVAGGSDCPMEPLNPLLGMQEAVLRASFPEQRLSVLEALRMYTVDAAYCSGEETVKGSIEEGKLADLTVLSEDPLAVSPDKIKTIKVEATVIDGKIAFQSF